MKDLCRDEKPREKLLDKGPDALSNAELLAIMLRSGTGRRNAIDLAREVLKQAGETLSSVAVMPTEVLCMFEGIGPGKAATLAAAFEIGRRAFTEDNSSDRLTISSPRDVFQLMTARMRGLDHEECWALFLNRANILIGKEMMSSGGMDSTVVDCRAILRRAIEKKASSVILVHNHPSGSAMPGMADIRQTGALKKALQTCEISLTDHVIISDGCYYSFADEQLTKAAQPVKGGLRRSREDDKNFVKVKN